MIVDHDRIARIGTRPVWVERFTYRHDEDGALVTFLPTAGQPLRSDDSVRWVTTRELRPTCRHESVDPRHGLLYCGQAPTVNSAYCAAHQVDHGEAGQ